MFLSVALPACLPWAARVRHRHALLEHGTGILHALSCTACVPARCSRSKAQASRDYPRSEDIDARCADLSDDQAELEELKTLKSAEAQVRCLLE